MKYKFTKKEVAKVVLLTILMFTVFGAVTGVYQNPFFQRMTPLYWFDYVFLSLESVLLGLFFGVNATICATKSASIGGVFGFLGFACPVCNKLLLFLLGSGFLLTYFEPIRPFVGILGVLLMGFAVYKKLSLKPLTQAI